MYKITIYELIIHKIRQRTRTIHKKEFIRIATVPNVPTNELSKKVIELKSKYKNFNYIVDFEKQESEVVTWKAKNYIK